MNAVEVVSFGFLHGTPPKSVLTHDLRPFRDPHVDPRLREMTARDRLVRDTVMRTPGVVQVVEQAVQEVRDLLAANPRGQVSIAFGCAGGRHRAPTVAGEVADRLRRAGIRVRLTHRDLTKPVVHR